MKCKFQCAFGSFASCQLKLVQSYFLHGHVSFYAIPLAYLGLPGLTH